MSSEYSAHHLQVLEGLEAVRKRPGMYIGSNDSRGLMHCLWEIIDNSVDEALGGFGSSIAIVLHADGSVEVRDRARGIPVDVEPRTGLTGVEVVFTKLHAGGKFGGGSYGSSGGLHGVGASVVNALSSRLDVEVDRGGKTWAMSFHRGEPGVFADEGGEKSPDAPFTPFSDRSELRVIGKVAKGVTGTRIRYWADAQIFAPGATFQLAELENRARQTAFLVPGLEITVRDERGGQAQAATAGGDDGTLQEALPPQDVSYRYDGGISEFVDFLAPDSGVTDTWRLNGSGTFRETVPVLQPNGSMVATEVERVCEVDIAVRWGTGYDTVMRSFVNIIATPKGGTHQAGFEQALLKVARAQVEQNARRLKVGNDKLEKDDVLAGLTAVLTVRLEEPQFEGQTKEVLGTPAVRQIVASVVNKELGARFASTKRDDKAQAALLLDKLVAEMKSRISARTHKETQRRKNARIPLAAREAGGLPQQRRGRFGAVHRRGRLRARHREARARQQPPGAAADSRQDPQRAEGFRVRHALERGVCSDHPGDRRGVGPILRSQRGALRQDHPDERRRRRRRAHPHAPADAVLPLHASADRRRSGVRGRPPAAPRHRRQPGQQAERDDLHLQRG